ncbi:HAMP domain-containing sensor histidine kinase [Peptoniphilus equinus]|uniref:histidine kinase n=1 Tax=Peptoniphilus equinus TaxID=3016343 RepID=A0ABY7QSH5_9FIRM|nr:HAMP domain-containing sensor histidine kinase [Peptoniphilus equinus]WBW49276.1 HAMP domain-containing sensor histidine kinase [Peptoniphilus equinus]
MTPHQKTNLVKNSMMFNFWKYFMLFAAAIILCLWLFQVVFLNQFYETMKIREVTKIGTLLRDNFTSKDFESKVLNTSQNRGMNIEVIDKNGYLVLPLNWVEVIVNPRVLDRESFNKFFENVGYKKDAYKITLTKFKYIENTTIVYGGYLGIKDGEPMYLLIKTNLEPVDAAVDILKNILMIVTGLSFTLSVVVAYFISKRLSSPLVKMSRTARQLAGGNYNVSFDEGAYSEIDDLSQTLNYATNELTKTIEMRKDIIANVSHDLKTPLTVIRSYAEMIRDISGDNRDKRLEHIDIIINESDKLTKFVNDLLDISKLEGSLENVHLAPVDLKVLTEDVLHRMNDDHGITIEAMAHPVILADKRRMEQVIYNFITNAVKYTGADKKIRIVIASHGENHIEYACIDNGEGIDAKNRDAVWDRFYRIRDNQTRPRVGTGLGLHIVKSILELHGFEYGVDSELGKGSKFYFIAEAFKLN